MVFLFRIYCFKCYCQIPYSQIFNFNSGWSCIHLEEPGCRIAPNSENAVKAMFGILQIHVWVVWGGESSKIFEHKTTKMQPVCQDIFTQHITGCLSVYYSNTTSKLLFISLFQSIHFQRLQVGYIKYGLIWCGLSQKEFCPRWWRAVAYDVWREAEEADFIFLKEDYTKGAS